MATLIVKVSFSAAAWDRLIDRPGPELFRFEDRLRQGSEEPSRIAFAWPAGGVLLMVIEGRDLAPARIKAAAAAIEAELMEIRELHPLPSRTTEGDAWIAAIVNAAPLEGEPCECCGATYPPHLKGCELDDPDALVELVRQTVLTR